MADDIPSWSSEEMHVTLEDCAECGALAELDGDERCEACVRDRDPDEEEERCIGEDCLNATLYHLPSECFTAESAAATMCRLGHLNVTYRRRRNADADSHEALTIWVNGALAGRLVVRVQDELELLDVLVNALVENGATESGS
jgi:hypothetical protein